MARSASSTESPQTGDGPPPPADPTDGFVVVRVAPADLPLSGRIFQLSTLYRQAMGRRLRQEKWLVDVGFRPPCIGAIMTVAARQPLSQRELSDKLGVDPSDLVNVLDILERAGFVSRRRDPRDRRRHLLSLTPDGGTAVRRLGAMLQEVDDEVLRPLTGEQRQQLRRLLDGVVAHPG